MDYHYTKTRDPQGFKYFDKEVLEAFGKWNELVFKDGKLDRKTKELIAVACTYMTRCPYCIEGHAKAALKAGATREELAEVIQIAMALGAGASMAHRDMALTADVKEAL
jgi:AhpD family alkylhydroperoxidase